jgi:mono/diheme cytochrome c family protein
LNGADLFREYCAVCHGNDAKGSGPAADALKKRPADLTQLARKNGGNFPDLHVMNFIKGQDVVAAHGTRDMPVWGTIFSQMSTNQDLVQVRVYGLLKYIEELQAK